MVKLKKTKLVGSDFYYQAEDKHIGERISMGKYEPYLTTLLMDQIRSGSVVVDVGANIGYYTVLAAKKGARVYAFEPESNNYAILAKNIDAAGVYSVNIFGCAVGNENKKVKILKSKTNFGDHRIGEKGEEVEMVKLDDTVEEKVDLIKIDVQGWEPTVIAGAKKIIKKYKPVIIMEYWPEGIKRAGLDGEKMIDFLKQVYGKIYLIDEYVQYCFEGDIKKLMKRNRRGDVSLMVGNLSWWQRHKDFWLKKWIKRMMGRALT